MGVFILQNPDDSDAAYRLGHFSSLFGSGNTFINYDFKPHAKIAGPLIIKIQAVLTDANNTDISAGFNGVLVDN